MNNYNYLLYIFLFIQCSLIYGQTTIEKRNLIGLNNIPQENIFVHQNATVLLTGEFLYYKIYCRNEQDQKLSNISKIAYIELVGTDKKPVFIHKIRLKSGLGEGDFFIPKSIPSGNYKLIAYTQWLRNFGESHFFQSNILILNPYINDQNIKIKTNDLNSDSTSSNSIQKVINTVEINNTNDNQYIKIKTNNKTFSNREEVKLEIHNLKGEASFGNYSISVRKIIPIQSSNKLTAQTYINKFSKKTKPPSFKNNDSVYLPELRGEIISGKIFFKNTNVPASNKNVALSIPGKDYIFKISTSNDLGIFYFNLSHEYGQENATIQLIDNDREDYTIFINEQNSLVYDNLEFNDFKYSPDMNEIILQQSIYNQIENAYLEVKPNLIDSLKPIVPFFNSKVEEYLLDDYTRFSTIKETLVEVIDQVYYTQKKGDYSFHVRSYNPTEPSIKSLVLVDGIFVKNHNDIIDYNPKKIRKISFVQGRYFYGTQVIDGILSIETINGEFRNVLSETYIKNVKLFKPLNKKNYFKQLYTIDNKFDRIPDYRSQLLWEPNFNFDKKEASIFFFTSDDIGNYEICLEGFTNEGNPISLREIINVK